MATYIRIPVYGKFWVMFDRDNGHPGGRGYVWIFETKKAALEHRREQHKDKLSARLTMPQKVVINIKK
jgi:hypothetical protein